MKRVIRLTLPMWAPMAGLTIAPFIFLKRGKDACLPHEMVHIGQQRRDGLIRFLWRYFTSSAWRIKYEAEGYAVDVKNGHFTIEQASRLLSGPLYYNCCTVDEARIAIEKCLGMR